MSKNFWLVLPLMLATSLLAQQVTNPPPAGPIDNSASPAAGTNLAPAAPAPTSTPAPKAAKKNAGKKKATEKKAAPKKAAAVPALRSVPLVPGTAVVIASNVNVRGQAKLNSEVVTRVTKDQPVTVLEEVTLKNSGPDEPSAWAKILLPTNSAVWVNNAFIDGATKSVVPKKLNVRSGPGENYSVLGLLQKGEAVKELDRKGDWIKIEAPANAYAFIAAQYLKQEAAPATLAATPAETPVPVIPAEPATVPETPAVAAAPTESPAITNAPAETPAVTPAPEVASTTNAPAEPVIEEPPPKRIVQREGIVRGTVSIQAPTYFALVSPENHKLIDYLHTTSHELDLSRYKGLKIVVTGEEALEERWGSTPVLTIQKIELLDE